jgi:hypothetical protein
MRRRDLLGGLSLVPLAAPAVAQCVVATFPRINLADRCEGGDANPPSLDLTFMVPGSLDPRITFTRASTATYFDSAGVLQTAAINAPRWDYDPAMLALRGMLIEEARTNLWLQSANAANAAWVSGSAVVAAPVVTANQTAAPDGTLTAARVAYPAVAGTNAYSELYQAIPTTGGNTYTHSLWLKGSVGGEQLYIACLSGATGRALCTLTTQWQRFSYTTTGTVTGTGYFLVGVDLREAQTSKPAQTVYVWGGQVEVGAFATSHIPTTTATVTRAIEVANVTPLGTWFNANAGSLLIEFDSLKSGVVIGGFSSGAFANVIYFGTNGVSSNVASVNVNATGTVVSYTGITQKMALAYATARLVSCNNGGATGTNAALAASPYLWTSNLTIGNAPWAPSNATTALCGHARRVSYWSRALTDAEMQAVTTL